MWLHQQNCKRNCQNERPETNSCILLLYEGYHQKYDLEVMLIQACGYNYYAIFRNNVKIRHPFLIVKQNLLCLLEQVNLSILVRKGR